MKLHIFLLKLLERKCVDEKKTDKTSMQGFLYRTDPHFKFSHFHSAKNHENKLHGTFVMQKSVNF